jgi:hypothetical protein
MKIATVMIGVRMVIEDDTRADVLMNYAMNSLNLLPQISGPIREVEVRELGIPDISEVEPKKHLTPMSIGSDARN